MTKEKGQETIIVLTLVCLIAFIKFNFSWLIYLGSGLLITGIISKKLTILIGKYWFMFSYYFGGIMNYFIMFFIFYLILTPLSFFQKLSGNNQILKKDNADTFFKIRNHYYTKDDIKRPW